MRKNLLLLVLVGTILQNGISQIQEFEVYPDGVLIPRLDTIAVTTPQEGQLIYFCGPLERVEKIAEYAMFYTFVEANSVEDIYIKLDNENRKGEAEIRLYKNGLGYYFDRIKKRILIEKIPITLSNVTIIPSVYHEIALSYEDNEEIKDKILKRFRDIIFYQNQP